jgi:hypothetical protein
LTEDGGHFLHRYEEETVARALVVYAVFSTFAYLVNLLLASRYLPVPHLSPRRIFPVSPLYLPCISPGAALGLALALRPRVRDLRRLQQG